MRLGDQGAALWSLERMMVMVRLPRGLSGTLLWPEFVELGRAQILRGSAHADLNEAKDVPAKLPGR